MASKTHTSRYKANLIATQSLRIIRHDPDDVKEAIKLEHSNGSIDPNATQMYQPVILKGRVLF